MRVQTPPRPRRAQRGRRRANRGLSVFRTKDKPAVVSDGCYTNFVQRFRKWIRWLLLKNERKPRTNSVRNPSGEKGTCLRPTLAPKSRGYGLCCASGIRTHKIELGSNLLPPKLGGGRFLPLVMVTRLKIHLSPNLDRSPEISGQRQPSQN